MMNWDDHSNRLIRDLMKTIEILRKQLIEKESELNTLKSQIRDKSK